jgi:exonuclease VII large subunit
LGRGYAMVQDESGNIITSVQQVKVGNHLHVSFASGSADATIKAIKLD